MQSPHQCSRMKTKKMSMTQSRKNKSVRMAIFFLATSILQLACWNNAFAQTQPRFGGPSASHLSFEDVSHAPLDALLRRYVDCNGLVCYSQWRNQCCDVQALEAYLHGLSQVDAGLPSRREAKMAFYINAYNAMTIWGILYEYPVASIQRIDGKRTQFAIFDDLQFWDGESYRSLNGIENDVLRPLGDPRIHFALVCAARGCPRLRNRAYTADALHWQLDDNAREFFSSHSRFHISRITRTVRMSPILEWYRDDFGQTDREVVSTVLAYLPQRDRQWLSQHCDWKFRYLGYDWSLNDQCPTVGVKLAAIPYRAYSIASPALKPFKNLVSRGDNEFQTAESCDSCDAASCQVPELVPFAPDEFMTDTIPDQL
ncbi:hypothetical protein TBK1r_11300 [Stieleria magnilauensis]|uniref:DUF547 domain-containing protein n=2 Tax=Stieleria magnilauensis TaxID=2527963 RepID=A0ABX5XLF7_9BACT|nr:hypothetical protein TBK1r_11300 [Planctomycetes bacterium TBK1r]